MQADLVLESIGIDITGVPGSKGLGKVNNPEIVIIVGVHCTSPI
jgi:hypothetical protein